MHIEQIKTQFQRRFQQNTIKRREKITAQRKDIGAKKLKEK